MAQQVINVGAVPNDGTGDTVRDAATKTNTNFSELYGKCWQVFILASDATTTSATAVDVATFAFTPAANKSYEFEAWLLTRTATTTVGPRPGLAWATGLTDGGCRITQPSSATANVFANGNINAAVLAPVGGLPNTTQSYLATINGFCKAGATPSGTVKVQLASETAGTAVTIKAGSYFRFREVP